MNRDARLRRLEAHYPPPAPARPPIEWIELRPGDPEPPPLPPWPGPDPPPIRRVVVVLHPGEG